MEAKQYATKQLIVHWSNQGGNKNIHEDKWMETQWSKIYRMKQNSSKKKVYSNTNVSKKIQKNFHMSNLILYRKELEREEQRKSKLRRNKS